MASPWALVSCGLSLQDFCELSGTNLSGVGPLTLAVVTAVTSIVQEARKAASGSFVRSSGFLCVLGRSSLPFWHPLPPAMHFSDQSSLRALDGFTVS